MWQFLIPLAKTVGPMIGGLIAGKKAKSAGQAAAGGATMQQLMPLMMQLMEQQRAASGQNYGMQMQRYQASLPMEDAIRTMAMRLLPGGATTGLPRPTPISRQPVPPMAPYSQTTQPGAAAPRQRTRRPLEY